MSDKQKLLVIDDDEAVFDYMERKIGYLYELITTTKPHLAVGLAIRKAPDLILCDIDMPGLDGGELATLFRECEYTRRIPFVYLTSFLSPSELQDLRGNVGGRPAIAKGARAAEMIQTIEEILR